MPQTTVVPPSQEVRLKAVLLWLRIAWLAAVGICVTQYLTGDLVGTRRSVNWGIVFLAVMLVTAAYLLLNAVARSASTSTRSWLSILAAIATGLLVISTGLLGLFAAWAYNPIQYALLVLFTVATWRVAKWL